MLKTILEKLDKLKLYHGSNIKFNKIEPKYMMTENSNMQEGPGIYFTPDLEATKSYGDNVMMVEVDLSKKQFINSREFLLDVCKLSDLEKMIDIIKVKNKEDFYYSITDWAFVEDDASIDEMKQIFINDVLENISDEEVRNVYISFCEIFGTENFVEAWNKIFSKKYYGTFNPELQFYAILDTKIPVKIL